MGYGSYVYSYAVTQLGTSADTAAYLNSAYWGCFALGRMAGVLASMHVQPRVMVITDLAGCCCALLINLAWHQSLPALWVGTCLYGFSVGSVYASCINHLQRLIDVSGRSLSSLTVFAAAGELIIPFIVGQLFGSSVGPLGMMYLCLVVAASAALVFGLVWKTDKQPVERPLAVDVRSAAEEENGTARNDPPIHNDTQSSTG
jgi:FHS family Na+ dependent glucose MFS transporter 1